MKGEMSKMISDFKKSAAVRIFRFAPKLHTISGAPVALVFCNLPFSQLTRFRYHISHSHQHLLELFGLMLNMLSSSVLVHSRDMQTVDLGPNVTLPHMRSFSIGGNGIPEILSSLTLPSLYFLDITGKVNLVSLLSLMQSSGPSLRELRIETDSFEDKDFIALADSIPFLKSLTLCGASILTEMFMSHFIQTPSFLSSLTSLTIKGVDVYEIEQYRALKAARTTLCILAGGIYVH